MAHVSLARDFWGSSVAVALCLSSASVLHAGSSEWFARPWQSEDGLPNNTVFALTQTPDGYLWLGTRTGLVRFDGVGFEEFSPTNFVAPPNRGIITMLPASAGGLWLAMDRGALVRLNGRATQEFTDGLPSSIPASLAEAADGTIWLSYHGGAVCRLQHGLVVHARAEDGLPSGNDSCALTSDVQGRVWFTKAGQAGVLQGTHFKVLQKCDVGLAQLAPARDGGVWLCAGTALSKLQANGQVTQLGRFEPQNANTAPTVLLEDHEGAVWIGTSYSGLFRHDTSGFEPIETTHQQIQALAEDRDGNIWVGTFGGGLNRLRRRAVSLEDAESGLPFASLVSICEDAEGVIWAATQNGQLARRTQGRWSSVPEVDGFPIQATCLTPGSGGELWIGNMFHGLYSSRQGRFEHWPEEAQLQNRTLHTLLRSRSGDLWVSQEAPPRLFRVRAGRLKAFDLPSDCRIVRAIAEDAAGDIWAGTSKGNLFRLHDEQLSEMTAQTRGAPASIRCLYATPDGALWIGYAGWGVGRLKDGHYAEIHAEQGLYDDQISAIIADGRGWLWFSADKGLFKARQADLEEVAEGRIARLRSLHYGRGEGLPSLEGNFGDAPNVLRSRDGRLWFPMRTALAVVDPARLDQKRSAPTVVLERVQVDDKVVASYSSIFPPAAGPIVNLNSGRARLRLPPAYRRLELQFTAFNYSAPETLEFRYRLDGFDDDWNEANRRSATYSRLPAGDYVFRVAARNSDGNWDSPPATLEVTVLPFFWQTWWFRIVGMTAFTLGIIGLVRYVSFRRLHRQLRLLEQQAALHKERARIAKDIHDDLGANLTQIALMGELAQQDSTQPGKASERMGRISSTARQALKALDEIVWAVNPRNDTLGHLIDYAGQFALDYLRLAGIRCRLDLPEQPPHRELSTDLRHNLFLAIKEALNNVVRHAHATEVWLRAKVTPEALEISIEDNGRGFACSPDDALADGLRNMRQRLAELDGECDIKSQSGAGTTVSLRLRWPA